MLTREAGRLRFDHFRCCQCGVCLAVCARGALRSEMRSDGTSDIRIDNDLCVDCGQCMHVCPAVKLPEQRVLEPELRDAFSYELAWARVPEVRFAASSGGVARSLAASMLHTRQVDATYLVCHTGDRGEKTEGCYLVAADEVQNIAKSQYRPLLACAGLNQAPRNLSRLLLIGTPCQLKGAVAYWRRKSPSTPLFTIAILCKQQKTLNFTRFLKRRLGPSADGDLTNVEYRGDGWPGTCSVGGRRLLWETAAALPFGKALWRVPGCRFCGDPVGIEVADLTLADPWIIVQEEEANGGMNLVFVWNERGAAMLDSSSSVIERRQITADDALRSIDFTRFTAKQQRVDAYLGRHRSLTATLCFHLGEFQRAAYEQLLARMPRKTPQIVLKILNRLPFLG